MRRFILVYLASFVGPSICPAQTMVQGWYTKGQVFLKWRVAASLPPAPGTYDIYASPALETDTANMTLVGRLFQEEWEGQRIRNLQGGVTLLLPGPLANTTYQLAIDEGAFVFTPHQAGAGYFAVVRHGDTVVTSANRDQVTFGYDPVNEPVVPHRQFDGFTTGGYPYTAYVVWIDGAANENSGRPDFPIMGNQHRRGVPHVFVVTSPLSPLPATPYPCVFSLHGGGGEYGAFRPGQPARANMTLELTNGIVVTPDDSEFSRREGTTIFQSSGWLGYCKNFDPFTDAVRVDPPDDEIILNYTSRRVFWFLDWLKLPGSGYNIDPLRVAVLGHSAGSWGASHLSRQHPELFCAAVGHNVPLNFPDGAGANPFTGKPSQNLATNLTSPITGLPIGRTDVLRPQTRLSSSERDFCCTRLYFGKRDDDGQAAWTPTERAAVDALNDSGMGISISWDEREHGVDKWDTDEDDVTDDPAHCDPWPDIGQWIYPIKSERHSAQYLVDTYQTDRSYPGFINTDEDLSANGRQPDPGPGDPCLGAPYTAWGTWGGYCEWDTATLIDEADRWECTVFLRGLSAVSVDNADVTEITADFSPRRTQQFNPAQGTPVCWTLANESDGMVVQSGTVFAGPDGLVTVIGLNIRRDPERRRISLATCRTITQWRSVRSHNGIGELAIVLNPTATGNGTAGPRVETRQGGIQKVDVVFDGTVTLGNASNITVTGPGSPTFTASTAGSTLTIDFTGGITDGSCYTITIGPGTLTQTIDGDNDCMVREGVGDTTGNGTVNLGDILFTKTRFTQPATDNPQHDIELSGTIDSADTLAIKGVITTPPHQVLCP